MTLFGISNWAECQNRSRLVLSVSLVLVFCYSSVYPQLNCQRFGNPTFVNGSVTLGDPLQTGRITRDGRTSGCPGKTNSLFNSVQVRYRSHTFTNPTGQRACVTVDIDFTGCGSNYMGIAAYSSFVPGTPAANLLGDLGYGSIGGGRFLFSVERGANFTIVVFEIAPNSGCSNYSFRLSYSTRCKQPGFDWNHDGKCDTALFDPVNSLWRFSNNLVDESDSIQWGIPGDIPVPGDYNGDGRTDVAVNRPGNNTWWWLSINDGSSQGVQWGAPGDIPVAADYDGDNKIDVAIFRPSQGTWYIYRSSDGTLQAVQWGTNGDVPVPGDYDGDRKADIAVYRRIELYAPNQAVWFRLLSNFNYSFYEIDAFGLPTDIPVQADYDGDGKTDIATYRAAQGTWFYYATSIPDTGPRLRGLQWGVQEDIPQPGDYDGDGIVDPMVYRPSNSTWYLLGSEAGVRTQQFGLPGEIPVAASFRIGGQ